MPLDSNDVEMARLRWGAAIVGGSIVAVIVSLSILSINFKIDKVTATDLVALMGTVTTFLGLAVGILFGVNAGGSARASTAEAASQMSAAAGKVADAAKAATDSAQQAADAAARTIDTSHAVLRDLISRDPAVATGQPGSGGVELLAGDPDDVPTQMVLSTARAIDSFTRGVVHIANPVAAQGLFADGVLRVADAEAQAGISRSSDKARVTEYLNLLGLGFLDEHGVPTRYCAAGVTWVACKAYCELNGIAFTPDNELAILRSVLGDIGRLYFKPSAGCQVIMEDAKARGTFMPRSQTPSPGHLVFYNWSGGARAEHIGIVEGTSVNVLQTVEFNTTVASGPNQGDGGAVARKSRALNFVLGYAKTY